MKQKIFFILGCLLIASTSWATTYYTLTLNTGDCSSVNTYTCKSGQQVALNATPMEHKHFVSWTDGNTDNPRQVTITQNRTYTAVFAPDIYTLTILYDDVMGEVTGAGQYVYGETAEIVSTAYYGYHFVGLWFRDWFFEYPSAELAIDANDTITIEFAKNQYTVTTQSPGIDGKVRGGGTYEYLDNATLEAVPMAGYYFNCWSDGNTENPRTICVTSDTVITAQFVSTPPITTPVTGIGVNKSTLSMNVGDTETLVASVTPSNATNKSVTWSSSNASIASVSSTGVVTAHAAGSTTITCRTVDGGYTATCRVSVSAANISVTGVSLSSSYQSMTVGATKSLTATVLPSNATNKNVTWSSSNASIASVSSTGVVTARAAGSATITCRTVDGGYTATCKITVSATDVSVTGVSLNKSSLNLNVGDTETLIANILPSNATNTNTTWSSSNTTVATVSSTGLVTARTIGSATITCRTADGGYTATCTVSVSATNISVTGVSLNKSTLDMNVGDTETLIANILPSNATNKNVRWSSSNATIAGVSSSGLVTARATGSATITCVTVDGAYKASCQVNVTTSSSSIDHLYMIGNLASGDWNITAPTEMTKIGNNIFKVTETLSAPTSYFAFTSVISSDWNVVNDNRWGGNNNDLVSPTVSGVLVEGEKSFTAAAGTYEFVVNLNTNELTLTSVNAGDEAYAAEPTSKSTINQVMTNIDFYDFISSDGILDIVMSNNTYQIELYLFTNSLDPQCVIAPKTYPINETGSLNTVLASTGGDEQYDYPSILTTDFQTLGGNTYYNTVYYIVSGTFKVEFVQGVFTTTLNATSYNGSTIKATFTGMFESIDNTIDETTATKLLRDGQVLIQRGDRLYDLRGQEVR